MFGTLHSNSATKTIDRIIDVFPTGDKPMIRAMLASSIQGVIAQTLLKKADGSGRVGGFEIMIGTNAVRNLIRENQIPQLYSMLQTGSRYGMITMQDAIQDLYEANIIDKDEARRAIMATTDEEEDENKDEEYASAALGGGRIGGESLDDDTGTTSLSKTKNKGAADNTASDEGYTF